MILTFSSERTKEINVVKGYLRDLGFIIRQSYISKTNRIHLETTMPETDYMEAKALRILLTKCYREVARCSTELDAAKADLAKARSTFRWSLLITFVLGLGLGYLLCLI